MKIESQHNNTFQAALALKEKKHRKESGLFLVEGQKQIEEIYKGWNIKKLFISEGFKGKIIENTDTFVISDKLFGKLSSTQTPQGIIAVVEKKEHPVENILKNEGFFVVLENIQDPGNLGTIIRSADAFGAKGVFVSKESADIYSDKVLRSTMGSLFHIPVIDEVSLPELFKAMSKEKVKIYTSSLSVKKGLEAVKFPKKCAVVIGNESKGISESTEKAADSLFKIAMPGSAESLNAAIAASIIMYEISKNNV